jgi:hypothetical protein
LITSSSLDQAAKAFSLNLQALQHSLLKGFLTSASKKNGLAARGDLPLAFQKILPARY